MKIGSWPLKMGPKGYPETSASNYHCSLRNNPEERNSEMLIFDNRNFKNVIMWTIRGGADEFCLHLKRK
jgi:hypothetical protein